MAKFELKLPKMGESVAEATVTNWLKQVGDTIEMDEAVLEIATDKVDSEVPSEVAGTLVEILFNVDDVVQVGQTIAIIETEGGAIEAPQESVAETKVEETAAAEITKSIDTAKESVTTIDFSDSAKFYSPLVRNIAKEEGVSLEELEVLEGSGKDGRINKEDILNYIKERKTKFAVPKKETKVEEVVSQPKTSTSDNQMVATVAPVSVNGADEIVEMDRMRNTW